MGGAQSDARSDRSLEELYKIVKRSSDGLSMLEERSTGKEYLLRQITSNLQNDFERLKAAVDMRRRHPSQHLLAVRETYTRTESNFCSNEFKLFLMVEYPFRNLSEEVEERRVTDDYFRENELWSIVYSCCLGLKQIYAYEGRHQALSSDHIYIEKDGLVKVGDPFLLGHQANCDVRPVHTAEQRIYFSPEQLQMLQMSKGGYDPKSSDVFTLAVVMMETACLASMNDIYEDGHSYINVDKIDACLSDIESRYSYKFRFLLEKMLRGDPTKRPTLTDIEELIQNETFEEDESRSSGVPYSNAPTEHPNHIANNSKRLDQVKPKPTPNLANNGSKETVARFSTTETNPDKASDRETLDRPPLQQIYSPANLLPAPTPNDYGKYGGTGGSFSTAAPYSLKFNSFGAASGLGGLGYQPGGFGMGSYSSALGLGPGSTFPMSSGYGSSGYTSSYLSPIPSYTSPSYMGGTGFSSISPSYTSTFMPTYTLTSPSMSSYYPPMGSLSSGSELSNYNPIKPSYDTKPSMPYSLTDLRSGASPQSPVDIFSMQQTANTGVAGVPRESPPAVTKQSLSPVQQLQTPERRDKANINAAAGLPPNSNSSDESGNSSAYQQVASLLPNSTIAEVTETEFSGSSENSLKYEVLKYEQGSRYEGYTLHGMRHGFGKFYYQDGGHYEGEWKDNKMNGFAKLYYQNNDLAYEGLWKDDQFHGKGKVFNDNPRKIDGPFDYTNLSALDECWIYYDGEFDEDSKHGHGIVKLSNGESFEGQFERDVINGEGVFHTLKGENIRGIWRENRLVKRLG